MKLKLRTRSTTKGTCKKNPKSKCVNPQGRPAPFLGLLSASLLAFAETAKAIEDPPGCSVAHGGLGASSQGDINFSLAQAHVGDTVSGLASFGMLANACKATNVTATIYLATGPLTNCLSDGTLMPGERVDCAFNVFITPALIGAPVTTPLGSVPGAPHRVRAVLVVKGTVLAGDVNESLSDSHSASI